MNLKRTESPISIAAFARRGLLIAASAGLISGQPGLAEQTDQDFWANYVASGKSALAGKDYGQAESLYQASLDVAKRSGFDDTHLDTSLLGLAQAYAGGNKYDQALAAYKQAIALEQKAGSPLTAEVRTTIAGLAAVYLAQGNYAEAQRYYQQLANEIAKVDGMNSQAMLDVLKKLADAAKLAGDTKTAETQYHQELAIIEKMSGMDSITTAQSLQDIGDLYKEESRWADAIPYYERAIANIKKHPGEREGDLAPLYISLAYCDEKSNDLAKASSAYKDALEIDKKYLQREDEVAILKKYAVVLKQMGNDKEANKMETRADSRQAEQTLEHELR
jgi:tetratricopeptide (TPR) repeat protein